MSNLFNKVSIGCSKLVTKSYSTSFSLAVKMLAPSIRNAIYSIYGFVRFADEIVDTFHNYDKEYLLDDFEKEYYKAYQQKISLNPILNAFQLTVKQYNIDNDLIQSFLKSMRLDLTKLNYDKEDYEEYIYGSADVVGLMCLKVFVKGDLDSYNTLKEPAMRLGSAFQKVNFLRDLKEDIEVLNRSYFPNIDIQNLNNISKSKIIKEIELDFKLAYIGIKGLPKEAKFGVYTAFIYYKCLLNKLKRTPSTKIMSTRIRVSNSRKISLLAQSFVTYKLNLM
ncbi:phytoene/squalene synthase family protein [Aureibaculum marinum]|uniref:Phytoene/squalene synthase family protein n=1 Tax=Aureibaculum marinum TaxID=2487930 RepID=A0A3N4N3F2_9FLAO|nr:phytoene/squalene synthase family protein [Aureibaculum marinum]RPD90742.1 phytoene/squalene synthase family protein [Aureibaculum marinum]